MIRLLPWLLVIGLLVPAGARAQQQVEVAKRGGDPGLRACVDYVGRGRLEPMGEPEWINDPEDLLGHGRYRFRFTEHVEILGHSAWKSTR